jgi:hypothetical protein
VDEHRHFSLFGELYRVANQIDDDLAQAYDVADDGVGDIRVDLTT